MKKFICALMLSIIALTSAQAAFAEKSAKAAKTTKDGDYWIKVNKEQLRLTLYKGQEPFKTWYVSVGRGRGTVKKSREDLITPTGTFRIYRVIPDATKLIYDPAWFKEQGEPQEGVYGAKLISFYNKWQIAIHGTNSPGSIGRRATHGCIRMRNKEIEDLVTYVRRGMRLVITDGDKDRKFYKDTI